MHVHNVAYTFGDNTSYSLFYYFYKKKNTQILIKSISIFFKNIRLFIDLYFVFSLKSCKCEYYSK